MSLACVGCWLWGRNRSRNLSGSLTRPVTHPVSFSLCLLLCLPFFCKAKRVSEVFFLAFLLAKLKWLRLLDIGHQTFHPGDWERMNTRDTQEFGSPGLVSSFRLSPKKSKSQIYCIHFTSGDYLIIPKIYTSQRTSWNRRMEPWSSEVWLLRPVPVWQKPDASSNSDAWRGYVGKVIHLSCKWSICHTSVMFRCVSSVSCVSCDHAMWCHVMSSHVVVRPWYIRVYILYMCFYIDMTGHHRCCIVL